MVEAEEDFFKETVFKAEVFKEVFLEEFLLVLLQEQEELETSCHNHSMSLNNSLA